MADKKLSALTNKVTAPGATNRFYTVEDMGGTPTQGYMEWEQFKSQIIKEATSPMVISGGDISEGTNAGTFKVAAITASILRTNDSDTADLAFRTMVEQDNQAITAADTTYLIYYNYHATTPTISISTTQLTNEQNIPIGKVMKDGSDNVHYISGGFNFNDGVRKLHERAKALRDLELSDGGATIAYSGTNNFTMTAGVAFGGINKFPLDVYNSATTQFTSVYQDGAGGWTYGAARNTIDFAHYDDGDGTLGNIGVAKYGNHWVYRHLDDGHVYVLYGRGNYSLAEAEAESEPTRPDHLTDFGILVGKIVAPYGGGSFTIIQMVSDTFFSGTSASNHAELGNLEITDSKHTLSATDKLVGRSTAGAGVVEEIACTAAGRALIDDADAAAQRTTLDVDQAGTDNSTDVTLNASATTGGMSLSDQEISNQAATNAQNGYMTSTLVGNIETNNNKDTNVSTNLSEGTSTETTVDVNSSDGDNATLVSASTSRAGLLTKAKFDEIVANTSAKHTQGTDTTLGAQAENLDMNTHKIVGVVDPADDQDAATKKYVDDNKADSGINADITSMTGLDDDGIPVAKVDGAAPIASPTFTTQITTPIIALTGGQIAFPATAVPSADPNTLDDYEEGTFLPTISFGGAAVDVVYNVGQYGKYTKIGNATHVIGGLAFDSIGSSSGSAVIDGMPFSAAKSGSVALSLFGITFADFPYGTSNGTNIFLKEITNGGTRSELTNADFTNNSFIYFAFTILE